MCKILQYGQINRTKIKRFLPRPFPLKPMGATYPLAPLQSANLFLRQFSNALKGAHFRHRQYKRRGN